MWVGWVEERIRRKSSYSLSSMSASSLIDKQQLEACNLSELESLLVKVMVTNVTVGMCLIRQDE